jgi:4-amino-4-deoxy-L-arabinose transferase-like glycosyltransferase
LSGEKVPNDEATMTDAADSPTVGQPAAAAPPPHPWRVIPILAYAVLVVVAWAGLELYGLGKAPFHTKGEPREGLVVWEMTHGGGWMLPRRNGVELPSKPPLFHWLGAVTSLLHGATDEWSIRFPSAALSGIALLCVFAAGTSLWSARAGACSALALMTTFEWARAATGARVDMTLTFGLQLAFLSLLFFLRGGGTKWLIALYAGISLAVLGKGPVGVILPGLVALVMIALRRDLGLLRRLRLGYGAATVSVVAGSWYVMALALGGWEFFRKQVLAENVFTFLDSADLSTRLGAGGHHHSVLYLLGALLLNVLPWTLFLPGVAARLWRQRRDLASTDARVFLLIWIAIVFGFYAVAASKRSVYLLALYPAVALLLGWWWDERALATPEESRWLTQLTRIVGWALMSVLALLLLAGLLESLGAPLARVAAQWLPPEIQPYAPWVGEAVRAQRWLVLGSLLFAMFSLWVVIRAARAASWMGIFTGVFGAVAALTVSVSQALLPGIAQHQSVRTLMANVRQVVAPTEDLFFFHTFDYGAVFYWQGHIASYEGPWPEGAPRYLLMQEDEWEQIEAAVKDTYARINFANDDNIGELGRLVLIQRIGAE